MQINPPSRGRRRAHAGSARRIGTATVEFAVVAPILRVLMLGMVEVTRAIQVKNFLTDTARSGCRYGVQPGITTSKINSNMNSILANDGINPSDATITVQVNGATADASTAERGDRITVKVVVPTSKVGWVTPLFLPSTAVASEVVHMVRQ